MEFDIFAVTAPGLEPFAEGELRALGLRGTAEPGGVRWTGSLADVFDANLHLRTASRILVRLARFHARTFHELERRCRRVPWDRYVHPGGEVRLRVTCRKSKLYHEKAVAERVFAAIDARLGIVPVTHAGAEEGGEAGQLFVVRVHRDQCTISVDASGERLHRRGYRQAVAKAPIRETLAAAMVVAAGWQPGVPLLDPFCGSGTIPIEAALIARGIPPGLASPGLTPRSYAFERWPAHDPVLWRRRVEHARSGVRPSDPLLVCGSDRDAGAVAAARDNAGRAGVGGDVVFERLPLMAVTPPPEPGWLVTNPPYGVRVGERAKLRDLYAALGNFARERLGRWRVAILSADRRLEGQLGLRLTTAASTRNGGLPVRIVVGRVPGPGDESSSPNRAAEPGRRVWG